MRQDLLSRVEVEENRGQEKWGKTDTSPIILLCAAAEELGEVSHAINHDEGADAIIQEIAETMGVLSRLYNMVIEGER